MKLCFKCRQEKALSEFYRHARMADGHLNKCKDCTKKDVNSNRHRRQAYYRGYDLRRYSQATRRQQIRNQSESWDRRNKDGKRAQGLLNRAVRSGRIERSPCSICGVPNAQGHHPDYSKPFEVMWLCAAHHAEQHIKEGRMSSGERWSGAEPLGTGKKTTGRAPKSEAA